ncbi:hypothetical protein ACTXG6_45755 [Pseudonocardia sp. Cha107L01]|uniref:hypothetical protein n=1 Tax=Pseudonocardia sp. Cha107L01 TaxID=3457576 RepID=UPI00403EB8B0
MESVVAVTAPRWLAVPDRPLVNVDSNVEDLPDHSPILGVRAMRFRIGNKRGAVTRACVGDDLAVTAETETPPEEDRTASAESQVARELMDAVSQWRDGGGRLLLDEIDAAFVDAADAFRRRHRRDFHGACLRLRTVAEAAQRYDPVPDRAGQRYWEQFLYHRVRAASVGEFGSRAVAPDEALIRRVDEEAIPSGTFRAHFIDRLCKIAPDPPTLVLACDSWWNRGASRFNDEIVASMQAITHASQRNDLPALRAAYVQLRLSTQAAQQYALPPGEEHQKLWIQFLQHNLRSANFGELAACDNDAALMDRASYEIQQAGIVAEKMADEVNLITESNRVFKNKASPIDSRPTPLSGHIPWDASLGEEAIVGSGLPAAKSPQPSGLAGAVADWRDRGGGGFIEELGAGAHEVNVAHNRRDLQGCRRAFLNLRSTAKSAQRHAPVPDEEAQRYWTGVLQLIIRTANSIDLSTRGAPNPELLALLPGKTDEIAVHFRQFAARLNAIGGEATAAQETQAKLVPATTSESDPALQPLMAEWRERGGLRLHRDLATAIRELSVALEQRDVRAVGACVKLRGAVGEAHRHASFPDDEAQAYWAAALRLCTDASNSGEQGTRESKIDLLDHASIELQAAKSSLRQFTARLDVIKKAIISRQESLAMETPQTNSDVAAVKGDGTVPCSHCRQQINASSNFCNHCGDKVER